MESTEDYDCEKLRLDINQAFRLADKWSHEDRLNSVASESIVYARFALQTALENLSLTNAEIKQRQKEEEKQWEEAQEQKREEKQEERQNNVECLLESFEQGTYPYKMTYFDARVVGEALPDCLKGKELAKDVVDVISSLLKKL